MYERRSSKTEIYQDHRHEGPPSHSHAAIRTALTTITRTITVAAGAFAPGHLGELTRIVPFELVDAARSRYGPCSIS